METEILQRSFLILKPIEMERRHPARQARRCNNQAGWKPALHLRNKPRKLCENQVRQMEYYRDVIEAGLHELFERRATICPMCTANDLVREQTLRDLIQLKPGYFHYSRCLRCGHIFQNPRLNARGLEFYYRDFYTG